MIAWIVEALIASTCLIVLVSLLRGPVARAFGARAAYALWALPALRLVTPPLAAWHAPYIPVLHVGEKALAIGLASPAEAARVVADPPAFVPAPPPLVDTFHWSSLLVALWFGGAVLWFAWSLIGYRRFLGRAMRSATLLTSECGTDVLLTGAVDGPVAAGILKRRIFLPLDFMTRYAPAERRLALLHEGAHHDRRDILANLVALAVLALHWFNPLAHRAYRLFRADQELACDETVLAELGAGERHAYGSAVVKAAAGRMPGVACALGHRAELKHRLRTMAKPMPGAIRSRAGLGLAAAAIGAGLLVTAPGRSAPPPEDAILTPADVAGIRTEAEAARREGEQAGAEADREAALDRAEAAREMEDARRAVAASRQEIAQTDAQLDTSAARRDDEVRQTAGIRREMAEKCAAKGRPVSPDLDWERLALCGDTGASIAARVQAQVHDELARQGID